MQGLVTFCHAARKGRHTGSHWPTHWRAFSLLDAGWEQVYNAQGRLVTDGIYRYMRHPQYTGIFIITLGFMIQWPTLATLILWPFVIAMYVRLAKREEQDVQAKWPAEYAEYVKRTPMFFPRLFAGMHEVRS